MNDLSLDDIGLRHGTDKASFGHDYLSSYERHFAPLRRERLKILEIGVLAGQSLRTWADYFENAEIVGFDVTPKTRAYAGGRIVIEIGDQSNVQHLINLGVKHGPFDIVIDDGSHMCEHQITTLRTLFPFLTGSGLYVVEDLQTNYGGMLERYRGVASATCVDYLKRWQDLVVGAHQLRIEEVEDAFLRTYGRNVESMTFVRHACLIRKNWSEGRVRAMPVLADEIRAAALPLAVVAQLAGIGGIQVANGCLRHIKEGSHRRFSEIFGFSLSTGRGLLQYRVRPQDGPWSEWVGEGAFLGAREPGPPLQGVAVRAAPEASGRYAVRTVALFREATAAMIATDGGDLCGSGPLHGLQIDVTERAQ